jgi:hypothetical protein
MIMDSQFDEYNAWLGDFKLINESLGDHADLTSKWSRGRNNDLTQWEECFLIADLYPKVIGYVPAVKK